mmetsp:Transcript_34610/g.83923  ORF Transcript_34610/g.83923 Transcript_34610/m.83923 type:complete len:96 (-) Transcript_34610:177-464(-)|eukprot:CAMPEP_0113621584 /NCGR_PEP_ID=MMETSP0017_2-20120614/11036_1 /TAXON_ID=2856 /ORGANISM="Cylindrotheca closterium" /LENGTH=95 /DNA_ID=CAMNT_0000531345 /DNA_START=53 /DNA_END=340 /DNA_ORIENTATION=- /assembly_acc=CAM_ASM_000147
MSEPTENEQGQGEANNETLTIRLRNPDGEETIFKIKKSTKLSKVFIRYARDKNVQLSSLRFLFDGERIEEKDTPKTLEMEDGDQVDVFLEQLGGY